MRIPTPGRCRVDAALSRIRFRSPSAITAVRIGAPGDVPGAEAGRFGEALKLLTFYECSDHELDLTLDGGSFGEAAGLRPMLPIRLRWEGDGGSNEDRDNSRALRSESRKFWARCGSTTGADRRLHRFGINDLTLVSQIWRVRIH